MIGAYLLDDVLVDPGPSSCLERLLPALERRPPRAIALTHIHLDHAGATGPLVRRFPEAEVWVHERGAPHLIDPTKLLASAARLYGDQMQRLWGEVLPVPSERLRVLGGGESLGPFEVAYTPGHASHHVAYLHTPSGCAFADDVAGVRIDGGPVLAPTPPPDIDLDAWRRSLETLASWRPRSLAVTHFGHYDDVERQLADLREHLSEIEAMAAALDADAFASAMRARVAERAGGASAGSYATATSADQNYFGLRRYLTARERAA